MTIGERIKGERKRRGLTQEELGTKLGVTQATVSEFESRSSLTTSTITKIASALDVSPEYVLSGQGAEEAQKTVGDRIRAYRQSVGLSQATFGRGIGVAPSQVGRWERGDVIPKYVTLYKIAKTFGVDIGYLIDGVSQEDKKKIDNGLDATICLLEECGVQLDDHKTEIIHSTLVKMIPSLVGLFE